MVDTIRQIIAEALDVSPERLAADTDISTLESWDSLRQVLIIAEIEDQLHASVPIEKVATLRRVQDFVDVIS